MLPAARVNVVPPTARTLGETDGYIGPDQAPESPDAATKVTPVCPAGVVKMLS